MGNEDRIDYAGPALVYTPATGSNQEVTIPPFKTPAQRTYADIDQLEAALAFLIAETGRFSNELTEELVDFSLPIPPGDAKLSEAVRIEWPPQLNEPSNMVSYRFYRFLNVRRTTSAAYIRQRFEEGVRDFTGTHSLDLLELTNAIQMEAKLVREFRSTYIGKVDDQAEFRSVELFMDWTQSARSQLESMKNLQKNRGTVKLPGSEISVATSRDAKNAQAMFKVKLNSVNKQVTETMSFIKRNYSDHADTFYGKFLGPALSFRLNASRGFHPTAGRIGQEMGATADATDTNLAVSQGDQMRRNIIFETKFTEAQENLVKQNVYRNYINQLAPLGKEITPGQNGTVLMVGDVGEEVDFFESDDIKAITTVEPSLSSSHGALEGINASDAHPQYLLKSGGMLTGPLFLEPGVTVDGIIPSTHSHNGHDGSSIISGTDILPGTVTPDVIDTSTPPPTPTNLHLVSQQARVVPPGVTVVDLQVAWEGDAAKYSYEIQTVPIT